MEKTLLNLEYLSEMRELSKMTLQDISDLTAIPVSTLSRVLNGETPNPGCLIIADICKVIGASMDEALGIKPVEHTHHRLNEDMLEKLETAYKEVFKTNAESVKQTYDTAYNRLSEIASVREKWLKRMFVYSIGITVLVLITSLVQAAGVI